MIRGWVKMKGSGVMRMRRTNWRSSKQRDSYFFLFKRINMWYHDPFHYFLSIKGTRVAQWVRSLDLTAHTSLSPIRRGFAPSFVNYKKGCTRLAAASDKVYQLLAQGRWFSSGTPASSTTKTGRRDIAEILLKVALNTKIQIQIQLMWDLVNLLSGQWICIRASKVLICTGPNGL
jgi:hypothetical protein